MKRLGMRREVTCRRSKSSTEWGALRVYAMLTAEYRMLK